MRKYHPAPPDEIRTCEFCGSPFTCRPKESATRFRKRPTCSYKCAGKLRGKNRIYLDEICCQHCKKSFHPRQLITKYCSRACYWADKVGRPTTYTPPLAERVPVTCPACGFINHKRRKELERGGQFCNRNCYIAYRQCNAYTEPNGFYLSDEWKHLKSEIKKRDSYTCQICQRKYEPNAPGIIVHHIRARHLFENIDNYFHPLADNPKNLITLCYSCHQKTHVGATDTPKEFLRPLPSKAY